MAKTQKVTPNPADARRLADAALADLDRARQSIERLSATIEAPAKGAFNAAADPAAWRAAHRSGSPSKLDTDAELRAFVMERIKTLTYDQIVQAVAAAFPPGRRTSRSTLSRWFRRNGGQAAGASTG